MVYTRRHKKYEVAHHDRIITCRRELWCQNFRRYGAQRDVTMSVARETANVDHHIR